MISGHRDAVYTRCPGNAAYSLMTALRRDADAAMRASPSANLESVTTGFNSLSVTQLAADPETSGPVYVWASFAGDRGSAFGDRERSDVAVAFPGLGSQHGFRATFTVPPGTGEVCVYAVNVNACRDRLIGCRWVAVSADPVGNLESITNRNGQIIAPGGRLGASGACR